MRKSPNEMLINPPVVFTFTRQRCSRTTFNLPYSCEHQIQFFTRLLCLFLHLNNLKFVLTFPSHPTRQIPYLQYLSSIPIPYSVVFVIRRYNLLTYSLSACATAISNMFNLSLHIINASVSFLLIESPLVEDARHDGCTPLFVSPVPQSTQRVAIATFWRTFHHDGEISPAWCGGGVHAHPFFTLSTITYKVVV
jgi:hypothetical protein